MRIYFGTDKGSVRIDNQDACNCGTYSDNSCWALVCDGMGGANAGDVASCMATDVISQRLIEAKRENMSIRSAENLLYTAISAANIMIYDRSRENSAFDGMGTTVVAAITCEQTAVVAHVGDSRAYVISHGKITRLTKDHSYVQSLIDKGLITSAEAEVHPYKNVITRALGLGEEIEIDCTTCEFSDGDILLLCSDGLTNYVNEDIIQSVLVRQDNTDKAKQLIELANSNGGGDNITAVAVYG